MQLWYTRNLLDGVSPVLLPRTPASAGVLAVSGGERTLSSGIEKSAQEIFGVERFDRYLQDAEGDAAIAVQLARWNQEFAGLLHAQIGYVELATRNAIDVQLRKLSLAEKGTEDWTMAGYVPDRVHSLVRKMLEDARSRARGDAGNRSSRNSHRSDGDVLHADVLAQLMWGTWLKLIGRNSSSQDTEIQQQLWLDCLHSAFAYGPGGEAGRLKLSEQLYYLRGVRNAEAHFDNLHGVARSINRVINTCYSVLNSINPELKQGWIDPGSLRHKARELKEILPSG